MTRVAGPDCAVMCNLIYIHTYIHTYIHMHTSGRISCVRISTGYRSGKKRDDLSTLYRDDTILYTILYYTALKNTRQQLGRDGKILTY